MNSKKAVFLRFLLPLLLLALAAQKPLLHAQKPPAATDDLLLATMEKELHRGQAELAKQDPAPYFTSYNVTDGEALVILSDQGGVLTSSHVRHRSADVSMRIGAPALDNTHDQERSSGITSGQLPQQDDPDAIARVLWRLTYEQYRKARQAYTNVKTKTAVRAKDEDDSPDFSEEKPSIYIEEATSPAFPEQKAWEELARRYSAFLPSVSSGRRVHGDSLRREGPQLPGLDRRYEDRHRRRRSSA